MKVVTTYLSDGKTIGGYCIQCPGCEDVHILDLRWTFNGNFDKPTFTPSLKCEWDWGEKHEHRVCHSFITDGNIQFLSDCTHKLKGQTVPLPENYWPDENNQKESL